MDECGKPLSRTIYGAGWLVTALAGALYLLMLAVTIPALQGMAGGQAIFDMRPLGYSLDEATRLLVALGNEGRAYYLHKQQWLDSFFPPCRALAALFWLETARRALVRRGKTLPGPLFAVLVLAALLGPTLDILENHAVAQLLGAGDLPSQTHVSLASALTVGKSIFDSIAYGGLIILAIAATVMSLRHR